jgi:hypothetical protein
VGPTSWNRNGGDALRAGESESRGYLGFMIAKGLEDEGLGLLLDCDGVECVAVVPKVMGDLVG